MDSLIGKTLVAVERLAWSYPGHPLDPRVGPVHMHFDGAVGVFLSGASNWSLEVVSTVGGDESWLVPYQYEYKGGIWKLRDAFAEPPFADLHNARLDGYAPVLDEMDEPVGMTLKFDVKTVTLGMHDGEIVT